MRANGRPVRAEQVRRLREEEGLLFREIGERLGIKTGTAWAYYTDPDGTKDAARKAKNDGVCIDCGQRTCSSGERVPPERCAGCLTTWKRQNLAYRERMSSANACRLVWTDEQILDAVVSVSRHGRVTIADYDAAYADATRGSMPSLSTVIHRFDLWVNAVHAAGLRCDRENGKPYISRMPAEYLLATIRDCAAAVGHPPSTEEYRRWGEPRMAPSVEVIRVRFGSWMGAMRRLSEVAA